MTFCLYTDNTDKVKNPAKCQGTSKGYLKIRPQKKKNTENMPFCRLK